MEGVIGMNMQIDWDKYMKDHHIKIYTEKELKKQKREKCKAVLRKCALRRLWKTLDSVDGGE